ncbi:MAG: 16S rRNA (cytidine(1402)-2'-O)-methyltransferase [Spirochaetes bacterium]|nr:16S rRNA (cytidine(1402)-2'-O)-methyltransferase [Spirochaetota bacterium]
MQQKSGTLYIIATPIGNLEDITLRAIRILREKVNAIFCEDTRQTRKLLAHLGISLPVYSLHSNSTHAKYEWAIAYLKEGNSAAYLTDSGTPGISDPGGKLVRECHRNDISVVPIPGASALTALLSVSGFPGKNILFLGFLSKKPGKRRKEIQFAAENNIVAVIYESPKRIRTLLSEIAEIIPMSQVVIGRELTKFHEEIIAGPIAEIIKKIEWIKEKGEYTVAIYQPEKIDTNGLK